MEEKRIKLKKFIEKYGEDFLEDGTKDILLEGIDQKDDKLILELLKVMDKDWISRTKEIGKFLIFTDHRDQMDKNGRLIDKTVMYANYIDSNLTKEYRIPTLRQIKPVTRILWRAFDDFER